MMTPRTNKHASPKGQPLLRVVDVPVPDETEVIIQRVVNEEKPAPRARIRSTPEKEGVVEEAVSRRQGAIRSNVPRLSIGVRIRENHSYQKVQKIKRAVLRRPSTDEMCHKKLFTRFEEAFLSRDISMLRGCLSPAFQWHLPTGQVVYGREEALLEMSRRFAMPNAPRFSATVWRFKDTTVIQTYEVEYLGPDGRWRQSKGMDLYEIGDGLITRKDAYWKMIP